ncbi:single-stranded DNA-binding protein [Neiella sp. HB171785]|uniref:Single-stranded DNA-binding protein n=1 Tax=Neiella litorisoli TaxID=2771431 RepID=A0A8J6QRJ1_9GAMM|nr:single-stranded DNA-binding protein [Neiella litorisoli]MBD1389374.1 single-stranded DNA-binding protein [Neiella litorisoli]
MKMAKKNDVCISGNISNVDVKNGQRGYFGSLSIAVDDGYRDQQTQQWVDRVYFVEVKVADKFLKSVKATLAKGDYVEIEGKLVVEKWKDKDTQQDRQAMKVQGYRVAVHIPKAAKDCLKAAGFLGAQQTAPQTNQQAAPQHNQQPAQPQQQGGYQSAPQQPAPQPGGFNEGAYNY